MGLLDTLSVIWYKNVLVMKVMECTNWRFSSGGVHPAPPRFVKDRERTRRPMAVNSLVYWQALRAVSRLHWAKDCRFLPIVAPIAAILSSPPPHLSITIAKI